MISYPIVANPSFSGLIGVSQADITPPAGIYAKNWGAATHETAEGVHKPLFLTCITFRSIGMDQPLVLIGADLGWWKSADDEQFLRNGILAETGLPAEHLMFCLSHTHAGPSLFREDAAKPGGHLIEPYLIEIRDKSVSAIRRAMAAETMATLTWNYGKCSLAVNRDLPEQGKERLLVAMNPGQPADDTLLVGRITSLNNTVIATIVNYACHPTTLAWENKLISPDYIGAMREMVETATGAPTLFLQGASGELSPKEQYVGDTAIADRYGRQLGHAVLTTLEDMLPAATGLSFQGAVESGAPLGIWTQTPLVPPQTIAYALTEIPFILKDMPSLAEIEAEWAACTDAVTRERLWRKRGIRKTVGDGRTSAMPLWTWRLGDSLLIGQPNEAYSDFQQQLRAQFKGKAVAVINIANGYAGYLPPENMYTRDTYAVWQTPFEAASLELLIEKTIETAQRILGE
ncbi:hypothetical protein J2Y45_003052 [Dyadobacter sp. BE34]|uniref:Neutral/alkaline non-lysosomal ceramidase N-terminal domain-containing protein n=1 Tax=Dyadobacter fermentans TaxID=94254 RepID=A0ABU1QWG1_9BACT|nr:MULTISPECIES: hypothetical protein [Dyadobacter]MDR6804640.1 hypothetical protein [Dyadobacter fermentans]MDR7043601.1 hypothetical protein [Dyadobacter sp. BE242]MDR7197913.1 hypothetical protein [Dyadobacter sp. BE34]MDR7214654.1 hypothetical protein [Dyadobacter sp. BE31]MDR7262189.1 hypothetical protein [Dyadobacter sp. BE32]